MGRTIRKNASSQAIVADARVARANAVARGGVWQALADQTLVSVLTHHADVETELETARETAQPLIAARDVAAERASTTVGRVADEIWNAVGRPGNDPALSLLFPGGIGYYVEGDVATQPNRMLMLAKLLTAGIHPQLPAARAATAADEVRASALELAGTVESANAAQLQVEQLDRVRLAIARNAGIELSNLKRRYKAEGFSESDIHGVIPNRPRKRPIAKPAPVPQAPEPPKVP
ncbi:hypothetical protein [Chondromyces apiculatus]|uniref:Uncharacterized protein n=1 Tax=Chondromyces apiculatus DSM 436 TaxID=1192034 RepID=A0A017T4S0_9BACT|nr:hypothetical protein [Chondromyces apiculatus]EYF03997.1 Hypothetical protein CAP_4871 [Chondromyces apiculatus DSM 436]